MEFWKSLLLIGSALPAIPLPLYKLSYATPRGLQVTSGMLRKYTAKTSVIFGRVDYNTLANKNIYILNLTRHMNHLKVRDASHVIRRFDYLRSCLGFSFPYRL